jgi:large subunit ribosomal protein L15
MSMGLGDLHPNPGAHKPRRRLGRGPGSGRGKTAGKGTKGQKARAGNNIPKGFEGGQNAFIHRMPVKRGLHNKQPARVKPATVNVSELHQFAAGEAIDRSALITAGLVPPRARKLKVLGTGELKHPLTITADQFSAGAKVKIEAAGGQAIVVGAPTAPEE